MKHFVKSNIYRKSFDDIYAIYTQMIFWEVFKMTH
jgi:hypothetical protein